MSRKPESVYTSTMLNKAEHEEKIAARNARSRITAFENFFRNARGNVAYVNVYGIAAPVVCR